MKRKDIERRIMVEHESKISQHPKDLFRGEPRFLKEIVCKGCGKVFQWHPPSGPQRAFCTSTCKLRFWRRNQKDLE